MRGGTVVIGVGTTNALVAEELLGRKLERSRFAAGVVLPKGTCVIPAEVRLSELVIRRGKIVDKRADDILPELGPEDVFIKGANALDASWVAGVYLADRRGGTAGHSLGVLLSRGVNLVVPVGLEKFIPGSVSEVARKAGIDRAEFATGVPLGMMPLPGEVVTELEAIRVLTGAQAMVMGKGGISGAEGAVTLLVRGTPRQLQKVRRLAGEIKGETYPSLSTDCKTCTHPTCWLRKTSARGS